ncbi:hypothetical protein WJX81_006344 [Elliptochloris bilobata]|uniref:Uncharacterized protein n=1 Tax=Elliptochloris bilobata TaxID=381761 RepID=A0AAW1SK52_9CHLO
MRPGWAKAHFRLGRALAALYQWSEAAEAFAAGLRLDPGNAEIAAAGRAARTQAEYEIACQAQHLAAHRRDLARRREVREGMERQFRESMAAPDWELEDYDWRPTFFPGSKLERMDRRALMADPHASALAAHLAALADLAAPKAALAALRDEVRSSALEAACRSAMAEQPGAHVLVLGGGGGLAALLAARSGAGRVTAVERGRLLFRMAAQTLAANAGALGAARIALLDRPLHSVGVAGEELPEDPVDWDAEERRVRAAAALMPARADVLVADLLDHSVLGMGLLPALDYAGARLLAPGARVVPACVQVWAMLVEMRVGRAAGFDLSVMDRYRWHPGLERVQLDRLPFRRLSEAFKAARVDLQARVDSARGSAELPQAVWESDEALTVLPTAAGSWNAVAIWFEVDMCEGVRVASWSADDADCPAIAESWCQAVQYLDARPVAKGDAVSVRVRWDMGQLHFAAHVPAGRARHAFVPRWHFDMVLDEQRNEAFDGAIRRAIAFRRGTGAQRITALDIGAGSGLLSMMALRAGADWVTAVEISGHMADAAAEALVANGFAGRSVVVARDVRRVHADPQPGGRPADLDARADIVIFEVFDSGVLGEGVLHMLAWARARLAAPDATLVPMGATVYCQPIEMRLDTAAGFRMTAANCWNYCPDYEGLDLAACRQQWLALADPIEAMAFDFYEAAEDMAPAEVALRASAIAGGICNAVAFWFELQLDEAATLSTSPYAAKGPTWQQAVQWVEETRLMPGDRLTITAAHDTYGLSFKVVNDAQCDHDMECVPLQDPAWKAALANANAANAALAQAVAQSPLEFRAVACAALRLAARPHDAEVDAAQAAAFATRMLS